MKGDETLSDVEKVARAIVEINVYLASQVSSMGIQLRYLNRTSDSLSNFPSAHSLFHLAYRCYHLHLIFWFSFSTISSSASHPAILPLLLPSPFSPSTQVASTSLSTYLLLSLL